MDISTTRYGHTKYTIKLADIVALGANLTGDITLDTLPPGVAIRGYLIKSSAALTGGTIATATAQLKLNSQLMGAAAQSVFTVGAEVGAIVTNLTSGAQAGSPTISSANVLKVTLTTTTGNLNAATSGQIDIVVDYSALGL